MTSIRPAQDSVEEAAKKAWLARLNATTWKGAVAAVEATANHMVAASDCGDKDALLNTEALLREEKAAKKAWLARLDADTWKGAADTINEIAGTMAAIDELSAACESGELEICEGLPSEDKAKKAWLAKRADDEEAEKTWRA